MQVTPAQLSELLTATIPACLPVLITGAPGIGKTDIVHEVTDSLVWDKDGLPYDLIVSHPVVSDPTDYKGLPFANAASVEATFLPFGDLARAIKANRPTVWFFDDLGQAAPSVQAALMQLFLARHINGKKISDHIVFVAATNRRADRAGVSGILEPVKSRFAAIVELVPTVDSFADWAFHPKQKGIVSAVMVAFLRWRAGEGDGGLLSAFKPTADMTNSPSPRTWYNLAKLEALNLPKTIASASYAGAVGEAAANEYLAFQKMFASLTSIEAILANPSDCKLPTKPNELYATVTALATKGTAQTLAKIGIVAKRLQDGDRGEFAALLLKDVLRRDEKLKFTPEFTRIATSPLGDLLLGK